MRNFLDFEKPIADLEGKIEELKHLSTSGDINIAEEVGKLQSKVERQLQSKYPVADGPGRASSRPPARQRYPGRHDQRFHAWRDRAFGDDAAVIVGWAGSAVAR